MLTVGIDGKAGLWYNLNMQKVNTSPQNAKNCLRKNFFPQNFRCLLCGIEIFEGKLCADCAKELALNDGPTCPKCGRKTAKSDICIECKAHLPVYDRALSPLVYKDGSAELIARFKNGRPHIAPYLAELIVAKIKQLPAVEAIVFVPMTRRAVRKREYNQSELLAKAVSEMTGIPVLYGAVEKIKETPAQKELPRVERLKNLHAVFKVDKSAVRGKILLVIDDIMTTGATLESLSRCLKASGAKAVFAVAAASVEYKSNTSGKSDV